MIDLNDNLPAGFEGYIDKMAHNANTSNPNDIQYPFEESRNML